MGNALIPDSKVAPYTLPLDRDEYARALRLGLGRALEHAREFGIAEFIDETADACVNCYEYDAQISGDRTDWMLDIIKTANDTDAVADHIARCLDYLQAQEQDDDDTEERDDQAWEVELSKKREETRSELKSTSPDVVISAINSESPSWPRDRLWNWGKEASDESLQTILNAIHEEREPDKLAQYLRVFMYRPIPKIDARLIELADHENDDVRRSFYLALRSVPHPSIRDLALRCVSEGKITEGQLELFKLNGGPGDADRIERSLYIPNDDWAFHTITSDLSILCEHNPTEEYAGLMRFVYENSNCGFCRMKAVESLLKANAAPDWLLQEVPSCSSQDVRDVLNPETDEDS